VGALTTTTLTSTSGNIGTLTCTGATLGTLGVTGAASLAGDCDFGLLRARSFAKTLGTSVGDSAHICLLTAAAGPAYSIGLVVTQSGAQPGAQHICKQYQVAMTYNATSNQWRRLCPLSSSGGYSGFDWAVDLRSDGMGQTWLRLVRTIAGGTSAGFICALSMNQNSAVTVAADTTTATGTTNVGFYENALITQVDGNVGVLTDAPAANLHVAGSAIVTGALTLGGALVQPTGIIQMYGGSTAPTGWLLCDGSLVSKTGYAALYALLGSTFGTETTTQFYLPDLRGRSPLGAGTGSGLTARAVGATGGAETHTLAISEMPSHNHGGATGTMNTNQSHSHSISYNNSTAGQNQYAQESNSGTIVDGSYNTNSTNIDHLHAIPSEGGGGAHNNMHPFCVVSFIIKT
jgi:microcystin-dependent protein